MNKVTFKIETLGCDDFFVCVDDADDAIEAAIQKYKDHVAKDGETGSFWKRIVSISRINCTYIA